MSPASYHQPTHGARLARHKLEDWLSCYRIYIHLIPLLLLRTARTRTLPFDLLRIVAICKAWLISGALQPHLLNTCAAFGKRYKDVERESKLKLLVIVRIITTVLLTILSSSTSSSTSPYTDFTSPLTPSSPISTFPLGPTTQTYPSLIILFINSSVFGCAATGVLSSSSNLRR
ncbi:hypothetical protein KC329_g29 [Hortaea werneckii]|nr:hypothetical protein KC329_g29 [Hortaea werneckii]